MNFLDLARAIFGLAFTLGLIGLAAYAARRYAPQLMAKLNAQRGERRMQVVETLVLDPARRLVLVRIDEEERLILLGEGRELIGWGMATGMWDAMQMFARASAVLHADGSLVVSSAAVLFS